MLENNRPLEESSNLKTLEDQVAFDLNRYLNFYPNKTFALRNLSKETGLNEKTLRRLLKKENIPSAQTLFKLYTVFTGADNHSDLLANSPELIRDQLANFQTDNFVQSTGAQKVNFQDLFEGEPILIEIYLLLCVKNVDLCHIVYLYGQLGSKAVEKLEALGLIQKIDNGLYGLTKKRPFPNGPLLKMLGLRMTKSFMKAEDSAVEGTNFVGLHVEGLNDEGRKKWLEIEKRSFQEKMQVANDPQFKGERPVFTFQATDDFETPARPLQ